jgi:hypothetical protein
MKKKNFLEEMYPYDPASRTFTIPISIERYAELYNHLDPSPIPLRDLAPDLVDYLHQCSIEIPNRYAVTLNLGIRADERDLQSEKEIQTSLCTFYKHEMLREKSETHRRLIDALKYLAISFLCLVGYFAIDRIAGTILLLNLLKEAVLIGGWLFMWETITVSLIEVDKNVQAMKKFERLVRAKIDFKYTAE